MGQDSRPRNHRRGAVLALHVPRGEATARCILCQEPHANAQITHRQRPSGSQHGTKITTCIGGTSPPLPALLAFPARESTALSRSSGIRVGHSARGKLGPRGAVTRSRHIAWPAEWRVVDEVVQINEAAPAPDGPSVCHEECRREFFSLTRLLYIAYCRCFRARLEGLGHGCYILIQLGFC